MRARFEVLTPAGAVGGIAVVAVRGRDRYVAAARLLRTASAAPFDPAAGVGRPRLALLVVADEVVDEVLVVDRPVAESVELHLHGSPAVLDALSRAVELVAPESAGPAERLLRSALGPAQLQLALEQRAFDWGATLADLRALGASARHAAVAELRQRSDVAMALAEPERVVLCGAPNAGKSTLMNRLLFDERALAGDEPGLTRDPIRERTTLDGYPYELVDTAGIGGVDDDLDRRAQELTHRERASAWQLVVVDAAVGCGDVERALGTDRTLWVRNKTDLPTHAPWPPDCSPSVDVSCVDRATAPDVRGVVGAALRRLRSLPAAGPVGGPAALCAEQLADLDSLA